MCTLSIRKTERPIAVCTLDHKLGGVRVARRECGHRLDVFFGNCYTTTESEIVISSITGLATIASPLMAMLGPGSGSNDMETIRVYEWMNWLSGTLHGQAFGALWRPQRFTSDPNLYSSLQEHAGGTIRGCFDDIEDRLSGIHSVGNAFTVVDAYLLVFWRWGERIGTDMEGTYPKYWALASAVLRRDSTKTAMEAEQVASKS